MAKKGIQIEKDLNIIAFDYLKISGAKDLNELKENHPYFYEKFVEEKNRLTKKNEVIAIKKIDFANLIDEVFLCKNCKKDLLYIIHTKKCYCQNTPHEYNKGVVKVLCPCGDENIFKLEGVD